MTPQAAWWTLAALLAGTLTVVVVSARAAWRVLHPPRISGRVQPDHQTEPFAVTTRDEVAISGWMLEPENPRGAVILCHNLGSHKARLLPLARRLVDAGYAAVLFDFRGHGESGGHKGFGTAFTSHVEDLYAVIEHLSRARPGLAEAGLVLLGCSLGTVPVLIAASEVAEVRGAILDSGPAFSAAEAFSRRFGSVFGLPSFPFRRITVGLIALMTGDRGLARDLDGALRGLAGKPLLVIFGENDEIVSREDIDLVIARADTARKRLWVVPHARHMTAFAVEREAYVGRVTDFLGEIFDGAAEKDCDVLQAGN